MIVLGAWDPENAELTSLTVASGDPTFSAPLRGVLLGLPVYHVLADEVASVADSPQMAWEVQVAVKGRAKVVDCGRVDGALIRLDEIEKLIEKESLSPFWLMSGCCDHLAIPMSTAPPAVAQGRSPAMLGGRCLLVYAGSAPPST